MTQVDSLSKVENVYQVFEKKILSGEWSVGECIPTETELGARFECSRGTVSKAIGRLAHEGYVERRKRAGTRVIRNTSQRNKADVELEAFAFIYPSGLHEGIWRTLMGFQDAANAKNRRVVTLSTGADFRREMELISRLVEFDVQGVAIYPFVQSTREHLDFMRLLSGLKHPFVLLDHNPAGMECVSVHLDCFHAGYTMTKYLIEKGLKEIGFFTNNSLSTSVRERHRGYCWAMQEAELPVIEQNVLLESSIHSNFDAPLNEPIALARTYLTRISHIEGVVCSNDYLAIALIDEAEKIGLQVPKDLNVVGIDDFSVAEKRKTSLTTYHVPFEEIGRKAFEVMSVMQKTNAPATLETDFAEKL